MEFKDVISEKFLEEEKKAVDKVDSQTNDVLGDETPEEHMQNAAKHMQECSAYIRATSIGQDTQMNYGGHPMVMVATIYRLIDKLEKVAPNIGFMDSLALFYDTQHGTHYYSNNKNK